MFLDTKIMLSLIFCLFICKNVKAQNRDSIENSLRLSFKPSIVTSYSKPNIKHLQFDPEKLPVFCKIEYKIDKATQLQVRFRLGSLDYVNILEGKSK